MYLSRHAMFRLPGLIGIMLVLLASPVAQADTLQHWRESLAATRVLAENDTKSAHDQAERLQREQPADAQAADKVRLLNLLARIEVYQGLTDEAERHATLAMEQAKLVGDAVGQVEAELNLAVNSINQARIDNSVTSTMRGLELLRGVDRPDLLGEAMLRMSMMYRRLGQVDDSVDVVMQLQEVAKRTGDPVALTYAYQGLALSYELSERHAEARGYYRNMIEAAHAAHSKFLEAEAKRGLAGILGTSGDTKGAERMFREAIALYRQVGAPFALNHGLFSLANFEIRRGRYAEALGVLDEAVAIYRQYPNRIGLWFTLNLRSEALLALGNRDAARANANQAYALARDIGLPVYLAGSARQLSMLAAASGEYKRAYDLAVEAADRTKQAEQEGASKRMVELAQRFASESKQRQIDELNRNNALQQAELQQQSLYQRWLWTLLGTGLLILLGSIVFAQRLRRSSAEIRRLNVGLEQRVQARTAELQQSRESLAEAQRIAHLGSWELAVDDNRLVWSDEVYRIFEVEPQQFAATFEAFLACVHPEDRERVASRFRRSLLDRMPYDVEHRIVCRDGRVKHVHERCETYYDDEGRPLRSIGTVQDVTELKRIEEAREAALAEAQRLARARSDFLAQMSHELRTPLNGILGYAQLLGRNLQLDDKQLASVDVIRQSGEHLLTLINDILDYAKIDAGKMELAPLDIDFGKFINALVGLMRVKAEEKGLPLDSVTAPDLPKRLVVDDKRLRQVLLNLVSNAIKFTERGGIVLRVGRSMEGKLRIEVQDSGIGIPEEQIERIFQPFEQAGDRLRNGGGTGLGLPISRQCVRLMGGGELQVESTPGQGSIFWFELPLEIGHEADQPESGTSDITGYTGARRTILVADDVPENRAVVTAFLTQLGFLVLEAGDGEALLAEADSHSPDLIVTDIVMPGMDGLEATRCLRARAAFTKTPIVVVSASAAGEDAATCLAAGANAFLPKPLQFDVLLQTLGELLALEWLRAQRSPESDRDAPLILPPEADIDELHRLAKLGSMSEIVQYADRIVAGDERYRPYADRLRRMAQRYQTRAILAFAEGLQERKEP